MTHPPDEPALFDLPLGGPPTPPEEPREEAPRRSNRRTAARPDSLPLFGEDELPAESPRTSERRFEPMPAEAPRRPTPVPVPLTPTAPARETAPLGARLRAAAGDLAIFLAVSGIAAVGARLLGATVGLAALLPLGCFLLAFSFLYSVVSLAFWGQTPGMAWSGLVARTDETEPLSFGQTALRWLGSWLTWALGGLPGLLALTGRSLADRISGSATYVERSTAAAG